MLFAFWLFSSTALASYAPYYGACPGTDLIREANSISEHEAEWIRNRHEHTNEALRSYLDSVGLEFDEAIFSNDSPNVGLAFSGGGLRASLTGAGQLMALDGRSPESVESGLGGVLQASSYIAGLSGGSWLMASLIFQHWPTVDQLANMDGVWDYTTLQSFMDDSEPVKMLLAFLSNDYQGTFEHVSWWDDPEGDGIAADLAAKRNAGFPVSITDVWGRLLAHTLFPEKHSWLRNSTWSEIRDLPHFRDHKMPFPLVTALARRPGSLAYDLNSPIVEFNPFEMGSFDTSIHTFHDVKYLGTPAASAPEKCVQGLDNAAFVVGTSSSLFNYFIDTVVCKTCTQVNVVLRYFVRRFLSAMSRDRQDIAWYKPNPFQNSPFAGSKNLTSDSTLYLMDGGLAGEIVPLSTLIVKERKVDVVFSFDSNGPDWPDGTSLINTYQRQFTYEGASTVCPYVPGQATFLHHNLTAKPTFFGCDAKNLTALEKDGVVPPIVVYMANRPYEFWSNTSTMKITYSDREKKGMIANGFDIATRGNDTSAELRFCVGCAMIRRAEERNDIEQSPECQKCFKEYCWDGSVYEGSGKAGQYFTKDGLTNEPTQLKTSNEYIDVGPEGALDAFLPEKIKPLWSALGGIMEVSEPDNWMDSDFDPESFGSETSPDFSPETVFNWA